MKAAEDYKKLYTSSFSDSPEWVEWMMQHVFDNDKLMLLDDGKRPVSALLLREYAWKFFGSRIYMSYIFGACTAPACRGQGHMGRLLVESLRRSVERNDALCTLIPANESLYDYYSKFGFARAIYIDRERYTAVHKFNMAEDFEETEPLFDDFNRLESISDNTVLHSHDDFSDVLHDLELDGGRAFAVSRNRQVCAMAFAVPHPDHIHVKCLYAGNDQSKDAVLSLVRRQFGELMIVVDCFADGRRHSLQSRGMLRLLDCFQILSAMAASNHTLQSTVRVRDELIAGNCDCFSIADGICRRGGSFPNLDVDISTLASIVCSSKSTGNIMGLHTTRCHLPLMLD